MTFREIVKRAVYFVPALYVRLFWSKRRQEDLLAKWQLPQALTFLERIIFKPYLEHWVHHTYLKEIDPDRREGLKGVCMGGESGEAWAAEYDSLPLDRSSRLHDLSFDEACPWYPAMDVALAQASAGTLVVQIGSSSGRELAYFAARAPNLRYLGIDIDEKIVRRANARYQTSNLHFVVGFAHEITRIVPKTGEVLLYSNGSLQYVQPEHLALMFERASARGQVTLVLGEPWREDGAVCSKDMLTRYRGNFSYSHDYGGYAVAAGLTIAAESKVKVASDPGSPHFFTRHYFLQARA